MAFWFVLGKRGRCNAEVFLDKRRGDARWGRQKAGGEGKPLEVDVGCLHVGAN